MPATEVTHFLFEAKPLWTGQIGASGVADSTVQTIPLQSASNLDSGDVYVVRINRVDSNGTKTTSPSTNTEVLYGKLSGTNLTESIRGAEGTAQAWAAGTVVEVLFTAVHWNKMIEFLEVEHNAAGTHKETALDSMIAGTEAQGDIIYHNGTIWTRLAKGTDGQVLTLASSSPSWAAASGGASYWTDVPGTPTRVSDTQFTITDTSNANSYDLLFKKGVILKWLESTTFQTAMVISSSYGTNTVTVNIVGDSLTAGFTAMQYAIPDVSTISKEFLIAGTFPSAATTNLSRPWHPPTDVYILSADLDVETAGSGTGSTVVDINVSGTTKFTTKPTLTTTGTTDYDNVADSPSTAVTAKALVSIDVDSVTATTAPSDGTVTLFYYPVSWRYR